MTTDSRARTKLEPFPMPSSYPSSILKTFTLLANTPLVESPNSRLPVIIALQPVSERSAYGITSYAPCLRHGPVALASSQTQPHFVRLGPCISNSMLHPRPNLTLFDSTSLCSVRSLYFQLNAKSQTQPHFIQLGLLNASSQTQPHFVWSLYLKLNAKSQTQPHFVRLGLCISNSMLSPRPNLTLFGQVLVFPTQC
ncbi:hypothetical protein E4T56_gene10439 [Termitomyces sp. T112]|nr:hypothetical protein E4T56_gene10439 [Termitomyces sp. T112]